MSNVFSVNIPTILNDLQMENQTKTAELRQFKIFT